jgi:cell division protein FtsB
VPRAEAPRPTSAPSPDVDEPVEAPGPPPRAAGFPLGGRRSSITTRAIALAVVLLILTISYASSLRIYFAQAEKISATRVDIAERQQRIELLREQLGKWEDPAYVRQQARERLGWVVPGEIGFRVIGPDGKPLGGGAEIGRPEAAADQRKTAWWQRLKGSVQTADRPAPTAAERKKAADEKPITENTEPR